MTPPQRYCEDHKLMAYQVGEMHEIMTGWRSSIRRIVVAIIISAILGVAGLSVKAIVHMQTAQAGQASQVIQGP